VSDAAEVTLRGEPTGAGGTTRVTSDGRWTGCDWGGCEVRTGSLRWVIAGGAGTAGVAAVAAGRCVTAATGAGAGAVMAGAAARGEPEAL